MRSHATALTRICAIISAFLSLQLLASENVPHTPFAEWATVPKRGQLVTRLTYQESEAYYFWDAEDRHKVDLVRNGEHYGIDINQGYLSLQYGLTDRWAADLAVGFTSAGWRFFSPTGDSESTTGIMDIALGVRYQIFTEGEHDCAWLPALTFRAGAVLPGTYDKEFAFAPGNRSTAIEPELLARKHFGWIGFGGYADVLFRWNHTTANDQVIAAVGFFQQIQRWELNVGYRHLASINGDNIQFNPVTREINYPRAPRENQDSIEAGFSYKTKKDLRFGFYSRTVFGGTNTDKKFWLGGYAEIPFQLIKPK